MLTINGKKFLNLPEAVQWLLDNNALPFQCKVNYVADTEIAKSNIINPSPTEIRIGSLVLFADGKVGTISGITASGFMVGAESTDLSDGVPHITGISINASQHLIFTMSEGDPIDAGLVKMVSSFSINASQHLIVTYNDGTTSDLGAIFQGNVNIAGNLTADSITENMSGYSFSPASPVTGLEITHIYDGCVKNGNKLTFVYFAQITKRSTYGGGAYTALGTFVTPVAVANKIIPSMGTVCAMGTTSLFSGPLTKVDGIYNINKFGSNTFQGLVSGINDLTVDTDYLVRIEATFLLSDSLA